jgi:hypothetical protein
MYISSAAIWSQRVARAADNATNSSNAARRQMGSHVNHAPSPRSAADTNHQRSAAHTEGAESVAGTAGMNQGPSAYPGRDAEPSGGPYAPATLGTQQSSFMASISSSTPTLAERPYTLRLQANNDLRRPCTSTQLPRPRQRGLNLTRASMGMRQMMTTTAHAAG